MATQQSFVVAVEQPPHNVNSWPVRERPLGRLYDVGQDSVSLVELLAILIGGPQQVEAAQRVIEQYHDLPNALATELQEIPGIGKSKAARIVAALELGRRYAQKPNEDRPQITSPASLAALVQPWIGHRERENFAVIYLNTRNQVLDREILYQGTLNQSLVRTAEVFRGAIRRNVCGIMVAHNHPSGNPDPSPEDIALTRRLHEAGKMLEVDLLDHVIVGPSRYVSIRERRFGIWKG
jgi:DNA repair protein RadC